MRQLAGLGVTKRAKTRAVTVGLQVSSLWYTRTTSVCSKPFRSNGLRRHGAARVRVSTLTRRSSRAARADPTPAWCRSAASSKEQCHCGATAAPRQRGVVGVPDVRAAVHTEGRCERAEESAERLGTGRGPRTRRTPDSDAANRRSQRQDQGAKYPQCACLLAPDFKQPTSRPDARGPGIYTGRCLSVSPRF
jgi:hypothetical protein